MCLGARRDSGSKKRHLHFIFLFVYFFLLSDQGLVDIWILLWTPHPAISHGRWLISPFFLSLQQPVMEGDLPPQSPSLIVLLEGSNHDSLWCLLQIQRSKAKSSISATTNLPSTGMMKQPRWQQCGIGQERGPGCRLRVLTKKGRVRISWCVSWDLVAIRTMCHSSSLLYFSHPLPPAWCPPQASKQHRLKRYHSQTYVNGSKCDLNGRPREAEVRVSPERGKLILLQWQFRF